MIIIFTNSCTLLQFDDSYIKIRSNKWSGEEIFLSDISNDIIRNSDINYRWSRLRKQRRVPYHRIKENKGIILGNIQEVESRMLSSIVEARVQEILSVAKFKIENKTKIENLSFGIILTGGGAELRSITEFSENIFPSKIRIGKPMKNIESVEDHIFRPKYSTAIGIIKYAVDHKEDLGISDAGRKRGFLRDFITNLKELWNN